MVVKRLKCWWKWNFSSIVSNDHPLFLNVGKSLPNNVEKCNVFVFSWANKHTPPSHITNIICFMHNNTSSMGKTRKDFYSQKFFGSLLVRHWTLDIWFLKYWIAFKRTLKAYSAKTWVMSFSLKYDTSFIFSSHIIEDFSSYRI